MSFVSVGNIENVKKYMDQQNIDSNNPLLETAQRLATADIAAIYDEIDVTLPANEAADRYAWELFNHIIFSEFKVLIAATEESDRVARRKRDDAYSKLKTHLGLGLTGEDQTRNEVVSGPPTIEDIL